MLNFSSVLKMEAQDPFEEVVSVPPHGRIEVFRDSQTLKLKMSDLTVERLARIFKVQVHSPSATL